MPNGVDIHRNALKGFNEVMEVEGVMTGSGKPLLFKFHNCSVCIDPSQLTKHFKCRKHTSIMFIYSFSFSIIIYYIHILTKHIKIKIPA